MFVLCLPLAQSAQAVEIYYARAIGQDFLPDTTTPAPPPASAKEAPKPAAPELPALGTTTDAKAATTGETSLWTKILVGVVVVGAIAALGNRGGGGSDDVNASTAPAPAPSSPPPTSGGFNIGIGGGKKK